MEEIAIKINCILAEWNPIGVNKSAIDTEYQAYIPEIVKLIHDETKLLTYLEYILVNQMGLDYKSKNQKHFSDLQTVCRKIIGITSD